MVTSSQSQALEVIKCSVEQMVSTYVTCHSGSMNDTVIMRRLIIITCTGSVLSIVCRMKNEDVIITNDNIVNINERRMESQM